MLTESRRERCFLAMSMIKFGELVISWVKKLWECEQASFSRLTIACCHSAPAHDKDLRHRHRLLYGKRWRAQASPTCHKARAAEPSLASVGGAAWPLHASAAFAHPRGRAADSATQPTPARVRPILFVGSCASGKRYTL